MKQILIFITCLLVVNGCAINKPLSHKSASYKELSAFDSDTIGYFVTNFEQHKEDYIGKPFSFLLNRIELPILSYTPILAYPDIYNYDGIYLSYYKRGIGTWEEDTSSFCKLSVKFEDKFPYMDLHSLNKTNVGVTWDKEHVKYLGDFIIKNIDVVIFPAK